MDKKIGYYNNIQVEIVAELPNNEVAINFITGLHHDYDPDYGNVSEPIENTIVVQKNKVLSKPITKDDIFIEYEKLMAEGRAKIAEEKKSMLKSVSTQLKKEHDELQKQIKEMKSLLNPNSLFFKNSKALETIKKIHNNEIKYVIDGSWNPVIYEYEELKEKIIKAIQYRLEEDFDNSNIQEHIDRICFRVFDGEIFIYGFENSNQYGKFYFFETLDEISEVVVKKYKNMQENKSSYLSIKQIENIKKYNINKDGKLDDLINRSIDRINSEAQKNIDTYKELIKKHKSMIIDKKETK